MAFRRPSVLPGFGLTMGYTLVYLGVLVLVPIGALFLRLLGVSWSEFWVMAFSDRAVAAYRLTFGASLLAAVVNAVFGTVDAVFGGWRTAQSTHFADGGTFDRIYRDRR